MSVHVFNNNVKVLINRNLSLAVCSTPHYSTESSEPRVIKNPSLSQLKRGTGGRSSFNGVVATVFGATGLLGGNLINKLGKIGTQLIIPYRGDAYFIRELKLAGDLGQVLFQPYHLNDEESIRKAVKYSNVVINLVGRDWETKNFKFNDVHYEGARRIARISREMGVERLIHVSALNVDPLPAPIYLKKGSGFLASKKAGEQAVRDEFPDATIFRPSDIYGQGDRFLLMYSHAWRRTQQRVVLWKKGEQTVKQPVAVSDVAYGILNAMLDKSTSGKIYQAVGPTPYLLSDLIDWMFAVLRRDGKFSFDYKRVGIMESPQYLIKMWLTDLLCPSWPPGYVTAERFEREFVSDILDERLPTLEDLGVKLTKTEDQIPHELKFLRAFQSYMDTIGEFENPAPPPPYIAPPKRIFT
ncbi:NADH dehydrogenase [ubiquinone] 1 alpha subcomplex subunit 9, mitochondrial [Rhopalosiphum padi]|uniref:NADH dehydrogenase [ubiquinone] 1 alpha subcomplex subunit 9, mitochondrial n=1 Tax=Rhopalosiphum padi TaxID=40932 RepID=UPI00298D97BC|nr:NADH dehydrogenase [ubiquinone] 1 alpha subcomplex subunit 9, mitochondrial [Rhopalosiphum padi]